MRLFFLLFCLVFLIGCEDSLAGFFEVGERRQEVERRKLHSAIYDNNIGAVIAIIDKNNANINLTLGVRYNLRPIHSAAYYGRDDIIKYLVMKGADLNALSEDGYRTALLTAIWKNHESTALLLLSLGADSTIKTSSGLSACTVANRAVARGAQLLTVIHALPNCTVQVPSDCK